MWIGIDEGIDESAMPCDGEGANRLSSRGEALIWQKSCRICNVCCPKQSSSFSLTVKAHLGNCGGFDLLGLVGLCKPKRRFLKILAHVN
jgi:hypothetical protein